MRLRTWIAIVLGSLLLASCGGGPVKRVSPPTASVQELVVRATGNWHLRVRLQNFSNVPMTFSGIDAELAIGDEAAGKIELPFKPDIPGESADVFEADLIPLAGTRVPVGDFAYRLHGTISSSDPKGNYKFTRESQLS